MNYLIVLIGILATFIVISLLFFIYYTGYFLLFLFDYSFLDVKNGNGILFKKFFKPEYYSKTLIAETPETEHWENSWSLIIKSEDGKKEDEVFVSKEEFYRYEIGQRIQIQYSIGRILKSLYIKKLLN